MKDRVYTNKIEEVMNSAMNNLKSLVDIDVVVGKPIISNNAMTIIPLTKVTMGFVSGGGEYNADLKDKRDAEYPFSGGSGGGMSIKPIGFLVIKKEEIELIKIDAKSALDRLIETVPEVAKFISKNFSKDKKENK